MTFCQQILSTLLGSIIGFIFAMCLFYITEKVKAARTKRNIINSLKREFQYNLALIDEWLNDIDKILRQITADEKQVYSYLKYSNLQVYFVQISFQWGILYDLVDNEDIGKLNKILSHCSLAIENYVMDKINLWKNQQIDKKEALKIFEFEKDELKRFRIDLEKINKKLNT